jgi:hypothetical protein
MSAIGRAIPELIGVLAAGFVGFFVMLAHLAGLLIWFSCGLVCFCFLLVALFSMVMWLYTRDAHAFHIMLVYFTYAGLAYAVIAAMSYYRGKLGDHFNAPRVSRAALGQTASHRFATPGENGRRRRGEMAYTRPLS